MYYSPDEVFELAEQIERNGAAYYRRAAEFVADEGAADFFRALAGQEDGHEKTFSRLRRERVPFAESVAAHDADDTAGAYLRALAGGYVFQTDELPSTRLSGQESVDEILELAIGQEKDSIVLYAGLVRALENEPDRQTVELVLNEEQRHLSELVGLLVSRRG